MIFQVNAIIPQSVTHAPVSGQKYLQFTVEKNRRTAGLHTEACILESGQILCFKPP
jgi:hypothetical protein